jgi:hypothetical protein
MMKNAICKIALFVLSVGMFGGCSLFGGAAQTEQDRIVGAAVDMICYAQELTTKMTDLYDPAKLANLSEEELAAKQAEAENYGKESEAKATEIVQKYGFKDMADFETVSDKYKDDKTMEETAKKMAKEKCNFDESLFGEGETTVPSTGEVTPPTGDTTAPATK